MTCKGRSRRSDGIFAWISLIAWIVLFCFPKIEKDFNHCHHFDNIGRNRHIPDHILFVRFDIACCQPFPYCLTRAVGPLECPPNCMSSENKCVFRINRLSSLMNFVLFLQKKIIITICLSVLVVFIISTVLSSLLVNWLSSIVGPNWS